MPEKPKTVIVIAPDDLVGSGTIEMLANMAHNGLMRRLFCCNAEPLSNGSSSFYAGAYHIIAKPFKNSDVARQEIEAMFKAGDPPALVIVEDGLPKIDLKLIEQARGAGVPVYVRPLGVGDIPLKGEKEALEKTITAMGATFFEPSQFKVQDLASVSLTLLNPEGHYAHASRFLKSRDNGVSKGI